MSEFIGDDDRMVRTAHMDIVQGLSRMIISLIDLVCVKRERKNVLHEGTSLGRVTQGLRVSPRRSGIKEVSHIWFIHDNNGDQAAHGSRFLHSLCPLIFPSPSKSASHPKSTLLSQPPRWSTLNHQDPPRNPETSYSGSGTPHAPSF